MQKFVLNARVDGVESRLPEGVEEDLMDLNEKCKPNPTHLFLTGRAPSYPLPLPPTPYLTLPYPSLAFFSCLLFLPCISCHYGFS